MVDRRVVIVALVLAANGMITAQQGTREIFDIVGNWVPAGGGATFSGGGGFQEDSVERQDGPALVDYTGIPLNDAGRARALSYNPDLLSVPEHQCMPHPATYSFWGPGAPQITAQVDENLNIASYQVAGMFRRADRTIWMDGRPRPPAYAPHTWAGFTVGSWEGSTLVTETTHLKWGWIRRNGVVTTDQATVRTLYNRHGNVMTITVIVYDPLYLTEPFIKTIDFIPQANLSTAQFDISAADVGRGVFSLCYPVEEVPTLVDHRFPHYLPWKNPFVKEEEERHHLPPGAALGGAETAFPEYRSRAALPIAPVARSGTALTTAAALPEGTRGNGTAPEVQSIRVQGNVWMLVGAGRANIAMQVGDDGVLLVDTGAPGTADAVLAAIRRITDKPIRVIVNTSADADHVGNNGVFGALAGGATTKTGRGPTPLIVAHSNVLTRMGASAASATPESDSALPTDAYLSQERDLYFNGETIQIIHEPAAYSDGDSAVYFRRSDVLVAGELFTTTNFARFDTSHGGSYRGVLRALNSMLDVAVPKQMQEAGTYIVPGRGRVADEADLVEARDQVYMIRDRLLDLIQKPGMTLDRVKAARPIVDFEGRYDTPDWTSDMFLAAVFRELRGQ